MRAWSVSVPGGSVSRNLVSLVPEERLLLVHPLDSWFTGQKLHHVRVGAASPVVVVVLMVGAVEWVVQVVHRWVAEYLPYVVESIFLSNGPGSLLPAQHLESQVVA